MENQLFNLKFTSKQFQRMSKKSEQAEKAQKLKLKQAIEKGNVEGAKIYAQNAIREKNQALNYLRLSSRLDGVAARLQTAIKMRCVTGSMANIVKGMSKAMESMDMIKITQVMDAFEKQFEDLDVQSEYVENAMSQSTSLTTPADQVDLLIQQVADEHGLEISDKLGTIVPSKVTTVEKAATEQDELLDRLNRLKAHTGNV
eukprot:TRINITY_DN18971_c0_g1_i1.p1 TRINITY_DN18971_c0_g1~~TRINITY_DN18971_c0_g1_i1.p1  ORF type:complete len:201 (-),score=83.97 TRINITY_DN18971_c0_g1_i1:411-1013(-)